MNFYTTYVIEMTEIIIFNFSDQHLLHFEEINDFKNVFLIFGVSWAVFLYHIIIVY